MKTIRIILYIVVALLVLAGGAVFYVSTFLPSIKVKDIKVESSAERIERGEYLANHVTVCMDCHSTRDWGKYSAPVVPGTEGAGGEKFDQAMGLPGVYYSPNITPFNLSSWSDGEIYRAITCGVNKEGNALFPIMPYPLYGKMDNEDIFSIIAYIRSLPSKENQVAKSSSDFPMNVIINMIPKEGKPESLPDKSDEVAYGKYLVNAASCADCHTPFEKGQSVAGMEFAGGREFPMPTGKLYSANISPDKNTGIGNWSKEQFVSRFKASDPAINPIEKVQVGDVVSIMSWTMYAGMDTTDLEAIYAYLMSVKAIDHKVLNSLPGQ